MDICNDPGVLRLFLILKLIFQIACIVLPIIIIILGTMDMFKAIINNKPQETIKEGLIINFKRLIAVLIIFCIPSIFKFIFTDLVPVENSINECFTNANLDTINRLTEEQKNKLAADKEAEKEKNNLLLQETQKLEAERNEQIQNIKESFQEKVEQNNANNNYYNGSGNINTEAMSGLANPNLTAKSFSGSKNINYWELVPDNISNSPALIVFLHGSGECGNLNGMLYTGMPKFMNNGSLDNFDAIFIAPNTASCSWSSDATVTKELIDSVVREYNVDTNHIIITGHSLGGNGTWNMVAKYPNFFSAAVPISGCPSSSQNALYVNIPIRSYVGASESSYIGCNTNNVTAINNMGGNVELIKVPSPYDSHGAVINIYGDAEVINWMLKQ